MMHDIQLQNPSCLQLQQQNGKIVYGYDQDWYGTRWQRQSGCGPTAATLLSDYVLQRDGILPDGARDTTSKRQQSMETIWEYVTPSHHGGLYKPQWFRDGLQRYLDDVAKGMYQVEMFPVLPFHLHRVSGTALCSFIYEGLHEDSPVAFLNLSKGSEPELQSWHWISIVEQRGMQPTEAVCYDNGQVTRFAPAHWQETTTLGGGLAYIHKIG